MNIVDAIKRSIETNKPIKYPGCDWMVIDKDGYLYEIDTDFLNDLKDLKVTALLSNEWIVKGE